MYVAHQGDTFILKRMPGTGRQHAPWCRSSQPVENDGRREDARSVYIDAITGRTQLRVAFGLNGSSRPHSKKSGPPAAGVFNAVRRPRMSLQDLLAFLWQRAELTRWHPSFAGRRNWAVVRARLLAAARDLWLGSVPLGSRLFVPEAFNRDAWHAIQRRRNLWLQGLQESLGARQLVLAELKTATFAGQYSWLTMRHLPDMRLPIKLEGPRRSLQEAALPMAAQSRKVVLATVSAPSDTELRIHRAAFLHCDVNWLPIRSGMALREPRPPTGVQPLPSPCHRRGAAVADQLASATRADQYGQLPR
jgi:hypothetical protein